MKKVLFLSLLSILVSSCSFWEDSNARLQYWNSWLPSNCRALIKANIIKKAGDGVKILGNGNVEKKNLTVKVAAFSKTAKEKIEAAGGKAEVI